MKNSNNFISKLMILLFICLMGGSLSAVAAKPPPTGACATGELTTSLACIGPISGVDSESWFNTYDGGTGVLGAFELTGWILVDKLQNDDLGGHVREEGLLGVGLEATPAVNGENKSGTWSVRADIFDIYEDVALVLKPATVFSAYLLDEAFYSGITGVSGTWNVSNTNWSSAGLSHLSVYVRGTTAVPLPAAAWLFGSGLLGFVVFARRKRAV